MLLLTKDLFVRLAISAQKDRSLNDQFKTMPVDKWTKYPSNFSSNNEFETMFVEDSSDSIVEGSFEQGGKDVFKNNDTDYLSDDISAKSPISIVSKFEKEVVSTVAPLKDKIDDKVTKIINNPHLLQIKAELEFAEALLKKIKIMDKYNIKIPVIEETISRLKLQLDQKTYV